MATDPDLLDRALQRERKARERVESLLEQKSRELYEANQRLEERYELAQKQAEELAELSDVVKQTGDAVFITDRDGVIEYVNPAFEDATGYRSEEVVGQTPRFLKSGTHDQPFYQELWSTIMGGAIYRNTLVNKRKDGSHYYSEKTISPIRNADGKIDNFVSIDRDITQRMEAERALRESENRFRRLFEQAGDAIFVHDATGRIVDVNTEATRMTGYTRDELLGMTLDQIDQDAASDQFSTLLEQTSPATLQGIHTGKDGSTYPVEARVGILEGGDSPLLVSLVRNMFVRRQLETQIVQSEKLASIGQLAAGVAHEINNPVGFVMCNISTLTEYVGVYKELLALYGSLEEAVLKQEDIQEVRDQIGQVKDQKDIAYIEEDVKTLLHDSIKGSERVRDIVQNLKSFARVDEAEQKLVSVNESIEDTLKVAWNEIKYKAEVTKLYGDLPPLLCYTGQLNQVFMNLLVNAAHAVSDRGEITIQTTTDRGNIVVKVSDNGCGIPADKLDRIFDPFYTTKEAGTGTGLGLSISQDIVNKHDGSITATSVVGEGSTFIVTLPIQEQSDET